MSSQANKVQIQRTYLAVTKPLEMYSTMFFFGNWEHEDY